MTVSSVSQKLVSITATTFETATTFVGLALKQGAVEQYRGIKFAQLKGRWTEPIVCNDYNKVPRIPLYPKTLLNGNSSSLIYDATKFGPISPQPAEDITGYYSVPKTIVQPMPETAVQDELESLNLVITRTVTKPDSKPLPVVVFIHGGSNATGSASNPLYDGSTLAHRAHIVEKPIVIVHIQYRLGALGWLYVNKKGNWAFLDQKAALGWVKAHISDFGGDPQNITVLGLSAGSCNTFYQTMLDLPTPEGCPSDGPLFNRIALMSGVGTTMPLRSITVQHTLKNEIAAQIFEDTHGDEDEQDLDLKLKAAPVEDLVNAGLQDGVIRIWYGTKDGVTIPEHWDANKVEVPQWLQSVILSDTSDEGLLFEEHIAKVDPKVKGAIANTTVGPTVVKAYELNSPAEFHTGLQNLFADSIFSYPIYRFQQHLSQVNVPTYRICFDTPNPFDPMRGSMHGVDILYLFAAYLPDSGHGVSGTVFSEESVPHVSRDIQDLYLDYFYHGAAWDKADLTKCYLHNSDIKMVDKLDLASHRRIELYKEFELHCPDSLGTIIKIVSSL